MDDHAPAPDGPSDVGPCGDPDHHARQVRTMTAALRREVVADYLAALDALLDGRGTGAPTGMLQGHHDRAQDGAHGYRLPSDTLDRLRGHQAAGGWHDETATFRYAPGVDPRPGPDGPRLPAVDLAPIRAALDRYRSISLAEPTEVRMSAATRDSLRDRLHARGLLGNPAPTHGDPERIYGLDITEDPTLPVGVLRIGPRGRTFDDLSADLPWTGPPILDPRAYVHIEPA